MTMRKNRPHKIVGTHHRKGQRDGYLGFLVICNDELALAKVENNVVIYYEPIRDMMAKIPLTNLPKYYLDF